MPYLLLAFLLGLSPLSVAAPDFPELRGRVVDTADMLSAGAEAQITALAEAHETATTNQVVVVTLPDLGGYTIEEYGYQLGRHWQIGQKDKNNGVLLIVADAEHEMRIEVGYGLEGDLTDAVASNIIGTVITPRFKLARFDEGAVQGVVAIVAALGGQYQMREPAGTREKKVPGGWAFLVIAIIIWSSSSRGGGGGLMSGLLLGSLLGGRGGRSGYRGGSFGGGGFGGGGGSFGGGGASGGW